MSSRSRTSPLTTRPRRRLEARARPTLLNEAVREAERRYLQEVLQRVGGQRMRAAQILGISRKTLWKKLKMLGLE